MRSSTANNPMDQQIFLCVVRRRSGCCPAQRPCQAACLARARADDGAGPTDLTGSGCAAAKGKQRTPAILRHRRLCFHHPHHRDGSGSGVCPAAWHRHRAQLPCQPARCRTDVLLAGKALDAANRPCGPLCSAVDPAGGVCQMDWSRTCRSVPLGSPARQSQLFSCQCTPNPLQRQLLPCPAACFWGNIASPLSLKNRFIPHLL